MVHSAYTGAQPNPFRCCGAQLRILYDQVHLGAGVESLLDKSNWDSAAGFGEAEAVAYRWLGLVVECWAVDFDTFEELVLCGRRCE